MAFAGAGAGAGAGASSAEAHPVAGLMDPVYVAQMRLRKRKYDDCIAICTRLLDENPLDQVRTCHGGSRSWVPPLPPARCGGCVPVLACAVAGKPVAAGY